MDTRLVRAVMERLSRGVVLRRRLPAEFGRTQMFVTPESALRYWSRDLRKVDPALLDWAEHLVKPGDNVWDVGANVGLFSVAAASRGAHVLAIEPDRTMAGLIERTGHPGVQVLAVAVSDHAGVGSLNIAVRGRSANFLSGGVEGSQTGGTRHDVPVRTVTLDSLLDVYDPPDLVKIDVEGSEEAVWRGAGALIEHRRPLFICEVPHARRGSFLRTFQGYTLFDVSGPFADGWAPVIHPAFNTLAVPVERRSEVIALCG